MFGLSGSSVIVFIQIGYSISDITKKQETTNQLYQPKFKLVTMLARISTLAVAFLTATSAASVFAPKKSNNSSMGKMLSGAKVLRSLGEEAEVDLTSYEIKFEKCQFVRAYNDEMAAAGADTVLGLQRFIIFKLCPVGTSCEYNYGEYIVDMEAFLQYTVEYKQEEQEAMCELCEEACYYEAEEEEEEDDEDEERRRLASKDFTRKLADAAAYANVDCDTCMSACQKIANMAENYYVDASAYINCQQLEYESDDGAVFYAGPMCGSNGSKIKIGVFSDEDCMFLDGELDVEDYLVDGDGIGWKLSHALLKTTYDNTEKIQCLAENEGDDDAAAAETSEVCRNVYEEAAKCEKSHGFVDGIDGNADYYNEQAANEALVCEYMSSLQSGTYSQDGEIVIGGTSSYSSGGTATTGGQKFALTFFILGTVGLAVYAAMLHSQLTKGGKADLSTQGGAMA